MYDYPKRAYELSYRPSSKEGGVYVPPTVVVAIQPQDVGVFEARLALTLKSWRNEASIQKLAERLDIETDKVLFARGTPFGFGECVCEIDSEAGRIYEFKLRGSKDLMPLSATCQILFEALESFFLNQIERSKSNSEQLIGIHPFCREGDKPYPVTGHISHVVMEWLQKKYETDKALQVSKHIREAMCDAFRAVMTRDQRLLLQDVGISVHEDGRPTLSVYGGVVGVIPTDYSEPEGGWPSGLSSDNMDSPLQQMTQLAGWSALSQLAEQELTKAAR